MSSPSSSTSIGADELDVEVKPPEEVVVLGLHMRHPSASSMIAPRSTLAPSHNHTFYYPHVTSTSRWKSWSPSVTSKTTTTTTTMMMMMMMTKKNARHRH
jgi:hypothetical protein